MDGVAIFTSVMACLSAVATGSAAFAAWRAAAIANRQHQAQQEQMRVTIFPQRHAIYRALQEFFALTLRRSYPNHDELTSFLRAIRDAPLFFDADLCAYLASVETKARELQQVESTLNNTATMEEAATRHLPKKEEILTWIGDEIVSAPERFARYLAFT